MNKYIPTKKELYLGLLGSAGGLAVLVLSCFVVWKSISSIAGELARVESTSLGIEETLAVKRDLAQYRDEILLLNSFFVNKGEEVKFIEKLEEVGKRSGTKIEINSISVGKKSTTTELIENLIIKVHYEGEWSSVAQFLTSVEKMPYAVTLGNIDANIVGKSLWSGNVDITVLKIKDV